MRVHRKKRDSYWQVFCLFTITNNAKVSIFVHVALSSYKRVSLEEKSRSQIAKSYKMIIFHHLNYSQMAL